MKILRINTPVVVLADAFDTAVAFYERLSGESARARLKNPTGSLDLAVVGSFVVIGGSADAIATRVDLAATFIVDSVDDWQAEIHRMGGTIVESPIPGPMSSVGPVGRFMFVRHPDGALFEYFQPNG